MLVVLQFPIADARRFVDAPRSYLQRPSWKAPQAGVVSEYVWGFGRVVARDTEVDPAWSDEACYVMAASSIRLPTLVRRRINLGPGTPPMIVTCLFRRLFHDGTCVARVEVGFNITTPVNVTEPLDARAVVNYLLALPSVVPETGKPVRTRKFVYQGPPLARRYRDASTLRAQLGFPTLVAAGNPIILIDISNSLLTPLNGFINASIATSGRIRLGFGLTRFAGVGIPTWYLGRSAGAGIPTRHRDKSSSPRGGTLWDIRRKLRMCLLRLHAEEEVLDRIVSWVDGGSLDYTAGTDAADRLDAYINRSTQLLDRKLYYGQNFSAIRDAYDAATKVNRHDITARRRAAFDGMRLQVRQKAELFIARRDAVRPLITVKGDYVNEKIKIEAQNISGSQIGGSHNTQKINDSFNKFAAAHGEDGALLDHMKIISDSVALLVDELQTQDPNAAREVTETFQSFAEEGAKANPRTGTIRLLGRALIEAAEKVAKVAVPLTGAVAAVMQIFGIPGF
jgi:hypothetical protein